MQRGYGGGEVRGGRGHGHGDSQDVVHQQGRGDREAGVLAQVHVGDLIVATAGRVGVDILPVGRHHCEQDHHDGEADPRGKRHRADAGQGQGQQDFVGRIGH